MRADERVPSEAELSQLRDAIQLSPARRLELLELLWAFARQAPAYRARVADQVVRERGAGYRAE